MKFKETERTIIAKKVLIANIFPICFLAKKIKGKLITKIKKEILMGVKKWTKREMPVTPPSINPAGIKNPLSANPAKPIPTKIKKNSLKKLKTEEYPLFLLNISKL